MKNKFLVFVLFVLIVAGLYVPASYSQSPAPHFTMSLANDTKVSATEYDFDIFILQTGADTLQLAGLQLAFTYNTAVLNGGTLTCSYVASSTDVNIAGAGLKNTTFVTTTPGLIQIPSRTPPGPGNGAFLQDVVSPGAKVGRLKMVNSVAFASQTASVAFDFTLYEVKIAAYVWNGPSFTNTDVTANGTFNNTLTNPTLPVELTSFISNVSGRQVNLSWETKTEVNSSKYEIDRALVSTKDATVTWTSVGIVQASGNSSAPKKYSYTEKNLQTGKYQYRLKMIDNDGSYKYSDVVETEISLPKEFAISQNYPNPFNPSTKIDYQVPVDAKVILEVYNITGQKVVELVNQDQQAGYYSVNFGSSSSKLASGVYIYRIVATEKANGNNFSSIKKMMLLK